MPKRKKYPRLPNAYGSIRFLGKNRTNCYAVHPPCTEINDLGDYVRPKAICYVDDWYVGFAVLNAWHAGTYKPGDEITFKAYRAASSEDLDAFCERLLTDFSAHAHMEIVKKEREPTFRDVYDQWYEWKYGENAKKKLSKASIDSTKAAFKNCFISTHCFMNFAKKITLLVFLYRKATMNMVYLFLIRSSASCGRIRMILLSKCY